MTILNCKLCGGDHYGSVVCPMKLHSESEQPVHTDHPLRHFDRTCPACIAEGQSDKVERTPRTDDVAECLPIYGSSDSEWVNADFARQLERELAEVREELALTMGTLESRERNIESLVSATAPQFMKIGALHRPRSGGVHFLQDVFSIPLAVHGTLDVYMATADSTAKREGK